MRYLISFICVAATLCASKPIDDDDTNAGRRRTTRPLIDEPLVRQYSMIFKRSPIDDVYFKEPELSKNDQHSKALEPATRIERKVQTTEGKVNQKVPPKTINGETQERIIRSVDIPNSKEPELTADDLKGKTQTRIMRSVESKFSEDDLTRKQPSARIERETETDMKKKKQKGSSQNIKGMTQERFMRSVDSEDQHSKDYKRSTIDEQYFREPEFTDDIASIERIARELPSKDDAKQQPPTRTIQRIQRAADDMDTAESSNVFLPNFRRGMRRTRRSLDNEMDVHFLGQSQINLDALENEYQAALDGIRVVRETQAALEGEQRSKQQRTARAADDIDPSQRITREIHAADDMDTAESSSVFLPNFRRGFRRSRRSLDNDMSMRVIDLEPEYETGERLRRSLDNDMGMHIIALEPEYEAGERRTRGIQLEDDTMAEEQRPSKAINRIPHQRIVRAADDLDTSESSSVFLPSFRRAARRYRRSPNDQILEGSWYDEPMTREYISQFETADMLNRERRSTVFMPTFNRRH